MSNFEYAEEGLPINAISLSGSSAALPHEMLKILSKYRVIVIGEMHGSCEIPLLVSGLAEQLLGESASLVVALEIDKQNQPGLNYYVETLDETILAGLPHFSASSGDGRASVAMAALVRRLAARPNIKFCAFGADFSEWKTPDDQGCDTAMAENLDKFMAQHQCDRVLVLCGNVHSSNCVGSFFDPDFRPMIYELCHLNQESNLQPEEVYSIFVDFDSGQTWSKSAENTPPPTTWSSNNSRFSKATSLQSFFLPFENEKFRGHDALVFIRTLSASPPFADIDVVTE